MIFKFLVIVAIIILLAVGFTIYLKYPKNKSLAPSIPADQTGEKNMNQQRIIREPAVAGAFYGADKSEIAEMINIFLRQVPDQGIAGRPRILIVPHAGHVYSGQTAAYAFKLLENFGFTKAILIGPSHNYPVSGLALSSATHWKTPLGLVELAEINHKLAKEDNFIINDKIHQDEHSLEVEIPFLQIVSPQIKIVPIIVGQLTSDEQSSFTDTLNKYLDSDTVLIVSVDLSHYHEYQEAAALDNQSIENILSLNSRGILNNEIDASWAMAAVLDLAKINGWKPQLLNYANSGDVTGEKSQVVGYSSFVFINDKEEENMINQDNYTQAEKKELLSLVRNTIKHYLKDGTKYEFRTDNPKFQQKRGVFVTLNKNDNLRGCIGYIEPIKPLAEAIQDNAISAAVDDNRFKPVSEPELNEIKIEISILTVPQVDTLENINKHKLGAVLKQGAYGATYLPQVWEDLSGPDQFWQSLCLKAGLSAGCYLDKKTEFLSYQAIVFGE